MTIELDEYKKKLISAEDAAKLVKSGDHVAFTFGREAQAVGLAIAARKEELRNVHVYIPSVGRDYGWYDPGWEDSFSITMSYIVLPMARDMVRERRADFALGLTSPMEGPEPPPIDILLTEVSPPDRHGYCSFGASLWDKKERVRQAKLVIAEVNPRLIRTAGDNFIHISEIDYFVENREEAERKVDTSGGAPPPVASAVAPHVASLLRDGDTIQIGAGTVTEWLPRVGLLDNLSDLGVHTEMTARGIVKLVREGAINGKRKTLHPGKVIATAVGGARQDMEFIDGNPLFEVYSVHYVNNPAVIAQNDNMVAINGALAVDLTGQIAAESVGPYMYSGPGGQLMFAMGAMLSKGGRYISVLPSTAQNGAISRIVPQLEPGTIVTVPRVCADYVVTEYGVAKLRAKTVRERALALMEVAHPHFREELHKAARRLLWP
ncbi:MAG: acetyl-CoA hydrolase/transferase family protein [Chloroflexi bacterium]|nr:acetyl-CoA hydrolase/transferase family protein [Chloroflexota bacterium]